MFWPFKRFRSSAPQGGSIEAIYGVIVAQAREPAFYTEVGVPDTVDSRFDMLVLHLWMVLRRLRAVQDGEGLAQNLFDHFCADMDGNLREMGVGDLAVPKRMVKFGEAFYGRTAAYDTALEAGEGALAAALDRNILNGANAAGAARIAAYVAKALAALAPLDRAAFLGAAWRFPAVPRPHLI